MTYIFSPFTASNCKQFIGVYTEHGNFYPYVKGVVKTKEKIIFRVKAPRWMQEAWDNDYFIPKGTVEFENKGGRIFPVIKGQVEPNTVKFVIQPSDKEWWVIEKRAYKADGSEVWGGGNSWNGKDFHTFHRGEVKEFFVNVPTEVKEWEGYAQYCERWYDCESFWKEKRRVARMGKVCDWWNKTRQKTNVEKTDIGFQQWISFTGNKIRSIPEVKVREFWNERTFGKKFIVQDGKITETDFDKSEKKEIWHCFKTSDVFDQQIISEGEPYMREFEWEETKTEDESEDGYRREYTYTRTVRKTRMVFDRVIKYTPKPEFVKYKIEEQTVTWYINAEK